MSKVVVHVQAPDPQSVKRGGKIEARDGFVYPAGFYLESSGSKRPIHRGPTVEVTVISDDGKVLCSENKTVVLVDKGKGNFDIELRSLLHVASSMEELDRAEVKDEKTQAKG